MASLAILQHGYASKAQTKNVTECPGQTEHRQSLLLDDRVREHVHEQVAEVSLTLRQ
jgi:hypothetical protein